VSFTGTNLPGSGLILVQGMTTATGGPMNGTIFSVTGGGTAATATSTIPNAYYKLQTASVAETGTFGTLAANTNFTTVPAAQASGSSSWYLTGVTCERCHITKVATNQTNTTTHNNDMAHFANGAIATGTPQISGNDVNPTIPYGTYATSLCMECHRQELQNPTAAPVGVYTANTVVPQYPPLAVDEGSCSNPLGTTYALCNTAGPTLGTWTYVPTTGEYAQGTEFLNSPHAEFLSATIVEGSQISLNTQNTADLSLVDGSVDNPAKYYSVNFNGFGTFGNVGDPAGGIQPGSVVGQSGCTGCHDPHQTIVGADFTGQPLASSPLAVVNATALQPGGINNAVDGSGNPINSVTNAAGTNWGTLANSGTVLNNNCNNCHAAEAANMGSFNHPMGPNTMFPNSSNGHLSQLDIPGSCMVCHMQGATGQPRSHLFRINPNPSYY